MSINVFLLEPCLASCLFVCAVVASRELKFAPPFSGSCQDAPGGQLPQQYAGGPRPELICEPTLTFHTLSHLPYECGLFV